MNTTLNESSFLYARTEAYYCENCHDTFKTLQEFIDHQELYNSFCSDVLPSVQLTDRLNQTSSTSSGVSSLDKSLTMVPQFYLEKSLEIVDMSASAMLEKQLDISTTLSFINDSLADTSLSTSNIEKMFACNHCEFTTTSKIKLSRHTKTHSQEICTICHKKYANKKCLNQHMKLHSDKGHCCCHCGRTFAQKFYCKRHEKTCDGKKKTGRKNGKIALYCRFENCDFVARSDNLASAKYHRKQHENSHEIGDTLACKLCKEQFEYVNKYEKHLDDCLKSKGKQRFEEKNFGTGSVKCSFV